MILKCTIIEMLMFERFAILVNGNGNDNMAAVDAISISYECISLYVCFSFVLLCICTTPQKEIKTEITY